MNKKSKGKYYYDFHITEEEHGDTLRDWIKFLKRDIADPKCADRKVSNQVMLDKFTKQLKEEMSKCANMTLLNSNKKSECNSASDNIVRLEECMSTIWDLYYLKYLPSWKKGKSNKKTANEVDKIDYYLDIIIQALIIIPEEGSGQNAYFYVIAKMGVKSYFLILLDHKIKKEEYTLVAVQHLARLPIKEIKPLIDTLPEFSLAKRYTIEMNIEDKTDKNDKQFTIHAIAMMSVDDYLRLDTKNQKIQIFNLESLKE